MGPKPPKELSAFCRGEWKIWVHCTFWTVLFTFSLMFSLSLFIFQWEVSWHIHIFVFTKKKSASEICKKKKTISFQQEKIFRKNIIYICVYLLGRYLCINNDGFLFNRFNKVLLNKNELIQTRKFQNTPSVTLSPTSTVYVPICTSHLPL